MKVLLAGLFGIGWVKSGKAAHASPPPRAEEALDDFASRLAVGPARRHENLTIYPVTAVGARVPRVELPLGEAIEKGLIEVSELKDSQVNFARVRSKAKVPVFGMAGEMLTGGKQDRILADDLIVPAGAELVVPVFCVEHGRWVVASDDGKFAAGKSLAPASIRRAKAAGQTAVWESVARSQEALGAPSPTGSLRSVRDSESVQRDKEPYRSALSDLPERNPKMIGAVVVINGEIAAADLFASPRLLRKLWPQLLEAYVVEALERIRPPGPIIIKETSRSRVAEWLTVLRRAETTPRDTPGAGTLYELRGPAFHGSALVWDHGVVHVEMFPAEVQMMVAPNRLDYRRQRYRGR